MDKELINILKEMKEANYDFDETKEQILIESRSIISIDPKYAFEYDSKWWRKPLFHEVENEIIEFVKSNIQQDSFGVRCQYIGDYDAWEYSVNWIHNNDSYSKYFEHKNRLIAGCKLWLKLYKMFDKD